MKTTATILPFPTRIVRKAKRLDDSTRHVRLRTQPRGTIELFVGDNGLTLIDGIVPTALALRVVEELKIAVVQR